MTAANFLQDVLCAAIASAGFGVLFNISFRALPWCAAGGALALAVRTTALIHGWSLEAASFLAAFVVAFAVLLLPCPAGLSRGALQVVGGIPLIPGAFAAKAILGLFAITTQASGSSYGTLITSLGDTLRVLFTIGALGTGLAIPTLLFQVHGKQERPSVR